MEDELDIMVLTLQALEGHMILFTDAQRDVLLPYMRGLASYEASRPKERRCNVIDFETAQVKRRLEGYVGRERHSAIADARTVLQHGVNDFGDCIYDDE